MITMSPKKRSSLREMVQGEPKGALVKKLTYARDGITVSRLFAFSWFMDGDLQFAPIDRAIHVFLPFGGYIQLAVYELRMH